ncbi:penicillin-binding transpeptidase domain-containing protein [Antrihabitans sp. YC2-6]|uniref:penicillin-binding transpeptidase domain-containing protein n=1 Tax=Antrihabitans sp. YC2-6 TaxID=2799498 RepID=UPI0027DB36B2|nr:penicillin-binding transpeptidase domain-containing protein [Antrihabitans sp. YC2-6]
MRATFLAVVAALLLLVSLVTACSQNNGPDEPATVAQKFADALNNDDAIAAAALTSDPSAARAALSQMYEGLGKEVQFSVADTADDSVTFDVVWKLGENERGWKYSTDAKAADTDEGWRIEWNPLVLAPFEGGKTGDLRFVPTFPEPAKVLDRANRELLTQQAVTLVNVDSTADLAAVAGLLAAPAPGVTAESLRADVDAAQGQPVTAVTLREQDINPIADALGAIPGVTLVRQARLLTTDRALSSPTFAGVTEQWQEANAAAQGWEVMSQAPDGSTTRLVGEDAKPTPDISTTLDMDFQLAAEAALAPVQTPAAIVAIKPSTGGVLAVAQNAQADGQGPIALTGLYPPGSTFKTVTTAAALQAGGVTPDTVLPCPASANIEGRTIPNDENFDLGQVPLHVAFARSCNTTMGKLAAELPPDALTNAAAQLGLGIDYVTPGLTMVTGNVPEADSAAQRVESGIGQGNVTASPYGMALVAASIANSGVRPPMLIEGQPGTGNRTANPLSATIFDQVRTMMRETVTDGTATVLRDIPDLRGKTGTAEHEGGPAHGWFIGIDGDVAFAVFVADGDTSAPALEAAGRFLRPVQALVPR